MQGTKMAHVSLYLFPYLTTIMFFLSLLHNSQAYQVKTKVYLSPKIVLKTGSVSNKVYMDIKFPRGHIALKSVNAELVDKRGNSVPLQETYLHHWVFSPYYGPNNNLNQNQSGPIIDINNSGVCTGEVMRHYYGVGSETRRTQTYVPDPYGIEVGKQPKNIKFPVGYEEKWMLNVHAIDTRGTEDKVGCAECRCDLYKVNVTALRPGYKGGLQCCLDDLRCKLKKGVKDMKRNIYLRYTVKYVDWDESIVPVNVYIIDINDLWTKGNGSKGLGGEHNCQVEYDVEPCSNGTAKNGCIDNKSLSFSFPTSGDVIYGVGHQHIGGLGIDLYGEGERVICKSNPIYGKGYSPGNEAGYVVGQSACYPSPGSVKISAGETVTLVSEYSNARRHTGVMGLMYLLIAESKGE